MNKPAGSIDRQRHSTSRAKLRALIIIWGALALLQARSPIAAQGSFTFDVVAAFGQINPNPHGPNAPLAEGTPGTFYGTTKDGGTFQLGTLFRLNPNGTVDLLASLDNTAADDSEPSGLIKAADGQFYFTDTWGGVGEGIIYRFDETSGQVTVLYEFTKGSEHGYEPTGALIQAADQDFYGTTARCSSSAANPCSGGTVFKMDVNGTVTFIHRFLGTDGMEPHGLIQGSDGHFYGTTRRGGAHDHGTVFTMDAAGNVTTLYSFDSSIESAFPSSPLVEGADGLLYGTTPNDSSFTFGSVFRIGKDGLNYSVVRTFDIANEGQPRSALIEASSGHFYGVTAAGSFTKGMVFDLDASTGLVDVLHTFASDGTEGGGAKSALILGSDGTFYGTTQHDGIGFGGVIYRLGAPVAPTYQLTVSEAGTGGGTVSSSPAGITCGPACSASFASGTIVTLTATPNGTSTFTGWSGAGCGGTGNCVVTMDAAKSVTATFTTITYLASVTLAGSGGGTVSSNPAAITCGAACSASFASGTIVTLTATPNGTSTFTGWSGAGCGGTGNCVVTMDAAKSVTATFTTVTYLASVTLAGSGGGTVSSNPAAITCGAACSASFASGTIVTLTATPNGTSTFTGWSGSGCSGTGTCVVTMGAAKSVTATFTRAAVTYPASVTLAGTGGGIVTSSPTGINCGATCNASFASGTTVTLTATPDATSTFTGWSGAGCNGTGVCVVKMNAAKNVTATFASTTPAQQLTALLAFFDASVANGTLTGVGSGPGAAAHLKDERKRLSDALDQLNRGKTNDACHQLTDAYRHADGTNPPPPDWVIGSARAQLAAGIAAIQAALVCR